MKLIAIGIDGFSFRLADRWISEGYLPNISALMSQGSHGILKSTIPPLTPPAWYSSLTGLNPGKQNIFGFFRMVHEKYAKIPVTASDLKAPAIWDYLGRKDKKSIILYLPMSYPPSSVNGIMVSGFMTPDGAKDFTFPPDTAADISRVVPGFRLNADHRNIRLGRLEEFYRESIEVMDFQVEAAIHLMTSCPWDFFFVHLHDIDSITHLFWKHQDPAHPGYIKGNPFETFLRDYYRRVDEEVGRLSEAGVGEETVLLLYSDHGFMPVYRYFSVNRWLAEKGFLKLKGKKALGLKTALASMGLGKEKISWWASRMGISKIVRRLPDGFKNAFPQTRLSFNTLAEHVDWPKSRAYFLSASEGSLYANVRNRQPEGCLDPSEADNVLREIKEQLVRIVDPSSGKPVLAGAYLREDIYHGNYAQFSPDMILLPADGYYFSENGLGPLFGDQGMEDHQISANHHPDGAIIAAGGPFNKSADEFSADICDIAPTIMHILGIPLPRDLDGRVLAELIDDRFTEKNPIIYDETGYMKHAVEGSNIKPAEMDKIIENLEGLGYF